MDPLIAVEDGSQADVRPLKNHARDVHIMSFAFFFNFCAYHAAQNLESTVNTEGGLGTMSLGIVYTSFTLFSLIASIIVGRLGTKRGLVLGITGYLLFIASNLMPSWYTMVPASLYLGFTASILWVSQGTYITSVARSHAREFHLHEGMVIGCFNGEFFGIFASTQFVGNLITYFLLGDKKDGNSTNMLFSIFLGFMILGAGLMCFLSRRDDKWDDLPGNTSLGDVLRSAIAPLLEVRLWLMIPLIVYSGLQQAFVWSEFTKHVVTPALGVSGVGVAMAAYGAADATCSLVAGRLTSGLSSVSWIVVVGACLQAFILLWLLFGYSLSSGLLASVYPLVMACIWGIGDGVFNTQLNALIGMLFKHDMEAAFGQMRVWQNAAIAVVFFLSPYTTLQVMLIIMLGALFLALSGFLYFIFYLERSSPS